MSYTIWHIECCDSQLCERTNLIYNKYLLKTHAVCGTSKPRVASSVMLKFTFTLITKNLVSKYHILEST